MASTAHATADEIEEHFDDEADITRKAAALADMFRSGRKVIAFTGAGISTSCGINSFRGPDGVWTCRAQGREPPASKSALTCIPSYSHMALVTLAREGLLHGLISQNTDGLHRKSEFPMDKFAELHGSVLTEKCERCGHEFTRDYRTRVARTTHDHKTGRRCSAPDSSRKSGVCGGSLHDTIINFGEGLPEMPLRRGFAFAEEADVCIVLGSSLRVTPAADMPARVVERGGSLVICNLQRTPLDGVAEVRVWARIDVLMRALMANLGLDVPAWGLTRYLCLKSAPTHDARTSRTVSAFAVTCDGVPATLIKAMLVRAGTAKLRVEAEDATALSLGGLIPIEDRVRALQVVVAGFGHYHESPLPIEHSFSPGEAAVQKLTAIWDLETGTWRISPGWAFEAAPSSAEPTSGPASVRAGRTPA